MKKISNFKFWFIFFLATLFLVTLILSTRPFLLKEKIPSENGSDIDMPLDKVEIEDIKLFSSQEEFQSYLAKAMEMNDDYYNFRSFGGEILMESSMPMADGASEIKAMPERYSETNVQVAGIDEPDIVKTDGINIYASIQSYFYPFRGSMIDISEFSPVISWPPSIENKTKIAKAFPVEELSLISSINKSGKMLLKDNILVIFESKEIIGYDVSNPKNPNKKWEINLNDRTTLTDARLYGGVVYLITSNRTSPNQSCTIEHIIINGNRLEIDCIEIYRPEEIVPIDTIYTVVALDLATGEANKKNSFLGSTSNSIIYVSSSNLYLSYFRQAEMTDFILNYFKERCSDIISKDVIQKLDNLSKYDISNRAKMLEMEVIMDEYFYSLSGNEQLRIENEITNRMPDYYEKNKRSLEYTGIIKVRLSDLEVIASGRIPGTLLNQFAMDEHDDKLRVATTIGERFWWTMGFSRAGIQSANDVYVLNEELKEMGSVKNLGLEERIYAVRFLGEKGYVVTFREIDPFYVLDLSNPINPQMKGELKIPGYSSYLHPISKNKILGIGRENWNVKISLFDVEDPYNPKEIEKYFLNESWSEILNNHHAFLMDQKYEIFFLPASSGAYIFSFKDNKISLIKAIKETNVKRALYIDNYFYIVSAEKIIVLNQENWEIVKEIKLY